MKFTPLDIKKAEFKMSLRGYNKEEVRSFLEILADDLDTFVKEMNELKIQKDELEKFVTHYKDMENTLKDTLRLAQDAAEDIKINAKKEAELMIEEAERKREKLESEIEMLKHKRMQIIEELRGLLSTHLRVLERAEEEKIEEPVESDEKEPEEDIEFPQEDIP